MKSCYTAGRIIRQNEPGTGMRSIIRIGNMIGYDYELIYSLGAFLGIAEPNHDIS